MYTRRCKYTPIVNINLSERGSCHAQLRQLDAIRFHGRIVPVTTPFLAFDSYLLVLHISTIQNVVSCMIMDSWERQVGFCGSDTNFWGWIMLYGGFAFLEEDITGGEEDSRRLRYIWENDGASLYKNRHKYITWLL